MTILNTKSKLNQNLIKEVKELKISSETLNQVKEERKKIPIDSDLAIYKYAREKYWATCKWRSEQQPKAIIQKIPEDIAFKMLSKISRYEILRSVWIGNHSVDLFIPAIGMMIEANGSVHYNEIKMKKDICRDIKLAHLNLTTLTMNNPDVCRITSEFLFDFELLKVRYKNSYLKRKMWRDIFILTELANKTFIYPKYEVRNEQ